MITDGRMKLSELNEIIIGDIIDGDFVQADDVSDSSPVAGSATHCDCGFKFPSHEGLPELIAEMLNEITTCSECTARQLDERIGDIKDGVR